MAVRSQLSHGLDRPRLKQTARTGLTTLTAFKLYLAGLFHRYKALRQAVEAAEQRRCAATIGENYAELDTLFAAELTFVHSTGYAHDKDQYLDFLANMVRTREILRPTPPTYRTIGTAVLVTGLVDQVLERRTDGSTVTVNSLTSQVWIPNGADWRLLLQHSTRRAS